VAIVLDYSYMLSPPVAGGITAEDLHQSADLLAAAIAGLPRRRASGELGFLGLPSDSNMLRACESLAAEFRGRVEDVVVLGIGGSALGTTALRSALLQPLWNSLTEVQRAGFPRLYVLDNIDPRTVSAVLDQLNLPRSLFVVISKSGGTAETMAQYLIVRERLRSATPAGVQGNVLFITDPDRGPLRALARDEGIQTLDVPHNVGGRFSVLSPVGIFPALLTGMDVRSMLDGAREMGDRCTRAALAGNPAAMYAALQWLADVRRGARVHVFMPYCDALKDFSFWFVQLWAESLGKVSRSGENTGPTPLPATGATDQHSQVQLFMEGPPDKTVTFVTAAGHATDITVPAQPGTPDELAHLSGKSLATLLDAERVATSRALALAGRPNMTLEIPRVDARSVGELIMLLEVATVIAGELYDVDPMNQPGVELGKDFTNALMGKTGSERALERFNAFPGPDPSCRV
jgi:glucose-6-phosphate isomerase